MSKTSREKSGGVKVENIKLTLRGDIERIRRFVARSIAQQVVKKLRDEDANGIQKS